MSYDSGRTNIGVYPYFTVEDLLLRTRQLISSAQEVTTVFQPVVQLHRFVVIFYAASFKAAFLFQSILLHKESQ